jgi:imidazoleglycerol-phosphate dehydratase
MTERHGTRERATKETQVRVEIILDGIPTTDVHIGVGFLDHMLELFGRHGHFGLSIHATGDIQVDDHHTVEDVGISLGQAIDAALGDRAGIVRFGSASVPMDEARADVAIDLSGRGFLVFQACYDQEKIGSFDVSLVREFLHALAANARMTLHINVPCGTDGHHITEAAFKALGRALRQAVAIDPRGDGVPSTKGVL